MEIKKMNSEFKDELRRIHAEIIKHTTPKRMIKNHFKMGANHFMIYSLPRGFEMYEYVEERDKNNKFKSAYVVFGDFYANISTQTFRNEMIRQSLIEELNFLSDYNHEYFHKMLGYYGKLDCELIDFATNVPFYQENYKIKHSLNDRIEDIKYDFDTNYIEYTRNLFEERENKLYAGFCINEDLEKNGTYIFKSKNIE